MDEKDLEFTSIRVGLLGDGIVGKTSICNTFTGIEFDPDTMATVGTARFEKKIILSNNKEVKLILWDTAGQERFRSAGFRSIRSVQGIALVFDFTNKQSFKNIEVWLDEIRDNLDNPCIVLLGNKIDIDKEKWQVTQEEVNKFAQEKKFNFYPTSAKTGEGINEAFSYIANLIYKKVEGKKTNNIVITNNNNNNNNKKVPKRKCC